MAATRPLEDKEIHKTFAAISQRHAQRNRAMLFIHLQNQLKEKDDLFRNQMESKDQNVSQGNEQLKEKDIQIERLHQLLAMKENNTADLTKQLDRAHFQIEDLHKNPSWWPFGRNR